MWTPEQEFTTCNQNKQGEPQHAAAFHPPLLRTALATGSGAKVLWGGCLASLGPSRGPAIECEGWPCPKNST